MLLQKFVEIHIETDIQNLNLDSRYLKQIFMAWCVETEYEHTLAIT